MYSKSVWKKYESHDAIMEFNEKYKAFISSCKTERLCVKESVRLAKENGFVDIKEVSKLSQTPFAILEIVLALAGASTIISAQSHNDICSGDIFSASNCFI